MTAIAAAAATFAGCGGAELPPAATPAVSPPLSVTPAGTVVKGTAPTSRDGAGALVLHARERELEAPGGERIPVGVGPTHVVTDGKNLAYVVDTAGDGLLVIRLRPTFEITRRVHVPGSPYGLAIDRRRGRLWVTATGTNELVQLAAGARPRPLRRFPTVRQPDRVAVEEATGRVFVTGRLDGTLQRLDAP
jgi:sugar lactone lactonase YvrE